MASASRGFFWVLVCAVGLGTDWHPAVADDARDEPQLTANDAEAADAHHRERQTANRAVHDAELHALPRLDVATVDVAAALREDAALAVSGQPPRFAIERPVVAEPHGDGQWAALSDGGAVWRLRIHSPGASSLNLGFDRFHLPPEAFLRISTSDGQHALRVFSSEDNKPHGELWTPPVLGDDLVIELRLADVNDPFELRLATVNVGYRGFGAAGGVAGVDESGECNVDVVCPEGADWRDQADAVGLFVVGGTRYCSGVMVNTTVQDRRPLFLTASHCGVTLQNAASVVVFWKYENSYCRPPNTPGSGGLGDGALDRFQTGAALRAASALSDFALLELDDDPDPLWGVSYAGWDRTFATPGATVTIHHPETNEKRISFDSDPPGVTSYLAFPSPGNGSHWRVIDWDLGTTEPGSSGGPLFNQDQRVVGQLHGGHAACGNDSSDWFGRFAISWEGGGSMSTRLRDWLDPLNTGASFLDHLPGRGLGVTPTRDVEHVGPVEGPFTHPVVVYTLSNTTASVIAYRVTPSVDGLIALNGDTNPVEGELQSNTTSLLTATLTPQASELESGLYEVELIFDDLTNETRQIRRHAFEVGQTAFDLTPPEGMDWSAPRGGPLRDSATYHVVSARPTPVTVRVTPSAPWLLVNGVAGPVDVVAATMGSPVPVLISLAPAAAELPIGVFAADVAFESLSGGVGDTTRSVRFEVGRATYRATDVPLLVQDFGNASSRIVVPDNWCIADLDVSLDIEHTYIGDLVVRLQSPSGTFITLHNRTGESMDNLRLTYDDDGARPDGPGALGDALLQSSAGTWTLFVSDNSADDIGALRGWMLRIRPLPGGCPVREVAASFPFDTNPGWVTQGGWTFGRPTGQGSSAGDPTSGATGVNVYGYNLAGDYPNNLGTTHYLTTRAIDCSNLVFTQLRFRRWLGVESAQFDHVNIEASRDGVHWNTVWEHNTPANIIESSWSLQSHDLSGVADGAATLYLRWGLGPTDGADTYAGWNIDDVEIRGVPAFADCNRNGEPDLDDLLAGRSADCDGNGAPDECDIDDGRGEDCDGDGVPDQCQCLALMPPQAEPGGTLKNRYVSIVPPRGPCPSALKITLKRLPEEFADREGLEYWVGVPSSHHDSSSPTPEFHAATLQCNAHSQSWDDIAVLHLYGPAVVPGAEYEVRAVHTGCLEDGPFPGDFSAPLIIATASWGDVLNAAPGGQPIFTDIAALVQKFRSEPGALHRTSCQLQPDAPLPDSAVNFLDVAHAIDAFGGGGYPFAGPIACP